MHGIENLPEDPLHHFVVSDNGDLVRADEVRQRTTRAVLHDEVHKLLAGVGEVKGGHAGVCSHIVVEGPLHCLAKCRPCSDRRFAQNLGGVLGR